MTALQLLQRKARPGLVLAVCGADWKVEQHVNAD